MAFLGFMTVREHEAVVGDATRELEELATSIWRAEFRHDAPEWQPLPDLRGLVSQVDNMYAGVRSQRDVQTDRANKLTEQMRWADNQTRAACAERDALAAELATLKAERDILDEACNRAAIERDKAATELAHWKKHGQLRDPATGRLIPKAKLSDVFTASHSPNAQAARGGDVREGV